MNFLPKISRRSFLAGSASLGAMAAMHPFAVQAQANQAFDLYMNRVTQLIRSVGRKTNA